MCVCVCASFPPKKGSRATSPPCGAVKGPLVSLRCTFPINWSDQADIPRPQIFPLPVTRRKRAQARRATLSWEEECFIPASTLQHPANIGWRLAPRFIPPHPIFFLFRFMEVYGSFSVKISSRLSHILHSLTGFCSPCSVKCVIYPSFWVPYWKFILQGRCQRLTEAHVSWK